MAEFHGAASLCRVFTKFANGGRFWEALGCESHLVLVGGLEHPFVTYFPMTIALLIIIPIDELHHFSEGFTKHQPVVVSLIPADRPGGEALFKERGHRWREMELLAAMVSPRKHMKPWERNHIM